VGQTDKAYRTLLDAEYRAPGEVRTRSASLVADLMQHRNHVAPHGLRDLAIRTYAVA
jgi:hypothetical protein